MPLTTDVDLSRPRAPAAAAGSGAMSFPGGVGWFIEVNSGRREQAVV
ncbi:MAG: hypothetical protein U5K76_07180 [Woeseiaceae bacterium]|nr:hypothetical protein [Woeseiaceae bacterium]